MLEKLPDVIGHALHDQRAGLDKLAFNKAPLRSGMAAITVSSLAFRDHEPLPVPYTADGAGHSPSLQWTGLPEQAQSAVLIVEDADAPTPQPFVHAIVVGLPPGDGALREGAIDSLDGHAPEVHCGLNSLLQAHWLPPDPPPGHGVHRYAFQLFALDARPDWSARPGREEVLEAIQAHGLASGCLIGTHERPDGSQKTGHETPAVPTSPLAI